jgi:hypothetical protein
VCGTCPGGDHLCVQGLCRECGDGNTVPWDGCNLGVIGEFQINLTTAGNQSGVRMAQGKDGRVLMVWREPNHPGPGLLARVYDPAAGTLTPEHLVLATPVSVFDVCAHLDGYVLALGSSTTNGGNSLTALTGGGVVVPGSVVPMNTSELSGVELYPRPGTAGGGVISMTNSSNGLSTGRLFNSALQLYGTTMAGGYTTTISNRSFRLFEDGRQISARAGKKGSISTSYELGITEFSATGSTLTGPINASSDDESGSMALAPLPNELSLLGWLKRRWDGPQREIRVRPVTTHAGIYNPYVVLSTATTPVDYTMVSAASLPDGRSLVAWQSSGTQDSDGVYGHLVDMNGVFLSKVGSEWLVNRHTQGSQNSPRVLALQEGAFLIVWISADQDGSGTGIFAQRLSDSGLRLYR